MAFFTKFLIVVAILASAIIPWGKLYGWLKGQE